MLYFQQKIRSAVHLDLKTGRPHVMEEENRKVQMAAHVR